MSGAVMRVGVAARVTARPSASPSGALMKGEDQGQNVKTHSGHHEEEPPVAAVGSLSPRKIPEVGRRHQDRRASHPGPDVGWEVTGPHSKSFRGPPGRGVQL